MLFWIFVIGLIIGIACVIVGWLMNEKTEYDTEWLWVVGICLIILFAILLIISTAIMVSNHSEADALVAQYQKRYESLVYQLENNLYDNDNDIGKKALYDEISYWNEDLAYRKIQQNNFWVGIFIPDIYDQFEFIKLGE